jgi:hypothetical protein
MSQAKGQRHHDTRQRTPGYVDQSRIELNSTIIEPAKEAELRNECEQRRSQRDGGVQRAMRSDAAVSTVGVITFSHDAQRIVENMSRSEQDALFLETAERLAREMGTDLTGLVVHRDEASIHAHFQMPAIRHDGRPISKVTDRAATSRLQDVAAEPWQAYGIERGVKKAERMARGEPESAYIHRSVRKLHNDLPAEIQALETKAAKNRKLAAETQAKIDAGKGDLVALEKRKAAYERRIAEAEKQLESRPTPKAKVIEMATREKRLFGLLPDKITTKKVLVIPPNAVDNWKTSVMDDAEHGKRINSEEAARLSERDKQSRQREHEQNKRSAELGNREAALNEREKAVEAAEVKAGLRLPEQQKTAQNRSERTQGPQGPSKGLSM